MLKLTKKLFKNIRNTFKRDHADVIDIDAPVDHDIFTYELPAVPVKKRKPKQRQKTKSAKKARRKHR